MKHAVTTGLVFIGFQGGDESAARELAIALRRRSVDVWFTAIKGTVQAGVPYWDQIQAIILKCEFAVFLLGAEEVSKGLKKEIHFAELVWRETNESHPKLAPVWLPRASTDLPLVLADLEVIRFMEDQGDDDRAQLLVARLGIAAGDALSSPIGAPESRTGAQTHIDRRRRQRRWKWGALTAVVAAAVLSVSIPALLSTAISGSEVAPLSVLRALSSAQTQLQASGALDTDGDGQGEYGSFGELASSVQFRTNMDGHPSNGNAVFAPPFLPEAFQAVVDSRVAADSYYFQIFLPSTGAMAPMAEDATGGFRSGRFPGSDEGEQLWCCYAWPMEAGNGRRVFFINQEGDICQYRNDGQHVYSGADGPPGDAAYQRKNDISSRGAYASADGLNHEGVRWTVLQ